MVSSTVVLLWKHVASELLVPKVCFRRLDTGDLPRSHEVIGCPSEAIKVEIVADGVQGPISDRPARRETDGNQVSEVGEQVHVNGTCCC